MLHSLIKQPPWTPDRLLSLTHTHTHTQTHNHTHSHTLTKTQTHTGGWGNEGVFMEVGKRDGEDLKET